MIRAAALMLALLPAQARAQAAEPEPRRSVMIVETRGDYRDLGEFVPENRDPGDIGGWASMIEFPVRVRHLYGRRYPAVMKTVMHAPYVRGTRLLVIAEPRRDGQPGFFMAYGVRDCDDGRFCIPEEVIKLYGVEAAFAEVPGEIQYEERVRCVLR
ncbi:MAG: hypothetical protein ACAH11_06610 [Sphingomonas sp.]